MTNQTEKSKIILDLTTKLALERTRVAYDRTMLAWVRTAIGLITFGFAIHKFFATEIMIRQQEGRLIGPREFGFLMILIGLVSLFLATLENQRDVRMLRALDPEIRRSGATVLAALIGFLGILALILVIFRK